MKAILDLPMRCRIGEDIGGVPTFVQEFGSIGYLNCSRKTEADFYRASLLTTLAHGCHGTMWWCAFDQGHLDYAPYRWNNIGSNYGFFDKNLYPKPLVKENLNFNKLLDTIPNRSLPPHSISGTILVPREEGGADMDDVLRASYILAKQANMDMSFSYALDPIPDSPLYILPSISQSKTITKQRLEELMKKVEDGAVLFMSADTGLFRDIPEITGVNIAYREQINSSKNICLGENIIPINATFFFKPESYDAEVIATDENGEGVFFKHRYGKGFVYFLTLPLEKHLSKAVGAFFLEDCPRYDKIYREIARAAGIQRTADSEDSFIRFTEHRIDDNLLYLFAINYSNSPRSAKISFSEKYRVETVFGNGIMEGVLTLGENDGALFKLIKE